MGLDCNLKIDIIVSLSTFYIDLCVVGRYVPVSFSTRTVTSRSIYSKTCRLECGGITLRVNFIRGESEWTELFCVASYREDWLRSLRNIQEILMLHSLAQSLPFGVNKKIPIFVENQDFTLFCFSLLWCHQGLMYPCKHLYLNALPLASIKKPRDWHV